MSLGRWGCLRCQVLWTGQRDACWVCGDDLHIVGGGVLYNVPKKEGREPVRYYPPGLEGLAS